MQQLRLRRIAFIVCYEYVERATVSFRLSFQLKFIIMHIKIMFNMLIDQFKL